ncbi:MAG: hypothetical protein AVDCRST_MAG52-2656, partial [uncultured Blastococcus sp.]
GRRRRGRGQGGQVLPPRGRHLLRRPVRRRVGRPVAAGHRRARRALRRPVLGVRRRVGGAAGGQRPGGVPRPHARRPAADPGDPPRRRGALRGVRGLRRGGDRPRAHL